MLNRNHAMWIWCTSVVMVAAAIAPTLLKPPLHAMSASGVTDSSIHDAMRRYICKRAPASMAIDGRLDKPAWQSAPWSDDFVDIEGSAKSTPRFRTRMKMLWDDDRLYIAAELVEPDVWATLTKKNSIIFHDNDFEIFIDPDGEGKNYYEFEMNALNTVMELTMDKPYYQHGNYKMGTNLPGLKSAVHVDGTLNDPGDVDRSWTVEVAIPWKDLRRFAGSIASPPNEGDAWRLDFSRVEWRHRVVDGKYVQIPKEISPEDNWVWSPTGVVDIHRPDKWGWVVFQK